MGKQKLKSKERGTENLPAQPTTVAAYWPKPAQPTRGSTVFILLPGGEAAACPVRRRTTPAPPCLRAPRPPGRLHAYHAASSTLSHSPSSSSPPLARSLTPTEHVRHHRRRPPWLPRPPRPTTVSPSSVVLLFLSSSTHATPGAAERRPRRLHHRFCPVIPVVNSPSQTPPRAR